MATDATGSPTSLGIPTYDTSTDAPSGLGFNAAMASIDALLVSRVTKPSGVTSGDVPVWNGTTWVRPTGTASSSVFLRGDGSWQTAGGLTNPMSAVGDLIAGGAAGIATRLAVGSAGQRFVPLAGTPAWATAATLASTPGTQSTSSGSEVMAGFAASITPAVTGKVLVTFSGAYAPTGTSWAYRLRHGTGGAPTNGAAVTGTVDSVNASGNNNTPGGFFSQSRSFSITALLTGLTLGTAVWLDLGITSDGSSSASWSPTIAAVEV